MLAEDATLLGPKQGTLFLTVWKVSWTSCSHWFPWFFNPHKNIAEVAKFVSVSDPRCGERNARDLWKVSADRGLRPVHSSSNWPFVIFQDKATVYSPSSSHGHDIHLECLWSTEFFYNKQCFFVCVPIFNLCVNCVIVLLLLLFSPLSIRF